MAIEPDGQRRSSASEPAMNRTALAALVLISSFAAISSTAPQAEAKSPLMISGDFGVRDLYPKTIRSYRRAKAKLKNLERAYRTAVSRRDARSAARIKRAHQRLRRKAQKALAKLKRVRTTRVVVWGNAMSKMPPKKIAAFLRRNPTWQGKTVHIYGKNGSLKAGKVRPSTFDRRGKAKRPTIKRPRKPVKRPTPMPGGFIPQTHPIPGANGPSSGGIFGLG